MSSRKFIAKFSIPNLNPITVANDATLYRTMFRETSLSSTTVVSKLMFKKDENVSLRILSYP